MAQSTQVLHQTDQDDAQHERPRRSAAEWTTLVAVLLILAAVIGVLVWYALQPGEESAVFDVQIDQAAIRQHGDAFYVPLQVHNSGRGTAEDVMVGVELTHPDGTVEEAELTFSFVAGGETVEGVAVLTSDPAAGALKAGIKSFLIP